MWLFGFETKREVNTEKQMQEADKTISTLEKKEELLNKKINEEIKKATQFKAKGKNNGKLQHKKRGDKMSKKQEHV